MTMDSVPRLMAPDNIDQEVNNNGNYCINQPCAKHLLVSLGISTFKWKQFNKRKQELEKAEADEVSNINFPYATQEMFEGNLIFLWHLTPIE